MSRATHIEDYSWKTIDIVDVRAGRMLQQKVKLVLARDGTGEPVGLESFPMDEYRTKLAPAAEDFTADIE